VDTFEIKEIVNNLPENEVRSYLFHVLLRIEFLKDKEYSLDDFSSDLKEMYNEILYPKDPDANPFTDSNYNKVHIIFGYPYLGRALKDLNLHKEEFIITFYDNFAIGPIANLDKESGLEKRNHWIKENLSKEDEFEEYFKSFQRAINQLKLIPEDVPICIWVSENAHEQTGLLHVMYLLKVRKNNIIVINTSKSYRELYKKKSNKYVPFFSGGILPEELQVIYKASQEKPSLSDEERAQYETQWLNLSENSGVLRIWGNGEIKAVSEDYYDEFIIEKAKKLIGKKKGFLKSARLIGEVYGHISQYVEDGFLEYRVRKLIDKGIFEYEGSLEAMRYYSIKFK
jgi:hypothetical protein